jgi:hypothetical protein
MVIFSSLKSEPFHVVLQGETEQDGDGEHVLEP